MERRIIGITRGLLYVGGLVTVMLMILTVVHAIGRYVFSRPVPGLVEMSSFMLVVIIFSTGAYTAVEKAHTTIRFVMELLSERTQAVMELFGYLLSLAIVLLAGWQAVIRGFFVKEVGYASAFLGIPHYPFYFVMALGWLVIGVVLVMHVIEYFYMAIGRARQ